MLQPQTVPFPVQDNRRQHERSAVSLDGHLFNFNSAPNRYGLEPFYELHVWAWRQNPAGPFADNNPKASCSAMKAMKM